MPHELVTETFGFPWVVILTDGERSRLVLVKDAGHLQRKLSGPGLRHLRVLGLGGLDDPVSDVIKRAETVRGLLENLPKKALDSWYLYLGLRDKRYELVALALVA